MAAAIGLLELKSIPAGIASADEMLKAANVELLLASPSCPGKYIIVVTGNVGAVKSAMKAGVEAAGTFLISEHIINNVHPDIAPAITGLTEVDKIASIGVIESISALASIMAGDIVAKAANIRLIEIRLARGLGGKGFLVFTGEVSAVKSALKAAQNEMADSGEITSVCVIASPHPDLIDKLLIQ